MEETERMVALKKAYAEIILNTSKEAAARVMASEQKAVRFQHDLTVTKEESLRMLLRLKQMINIKTTEADKISQTQKLKIEELEAQLLEAHGTISDLKKELENVKHELKKLKESHASALKGESAEGNVYSFEETSTDHGHFFEPIVPYSSDSELENETASEMMDEPSYRRIHESYCHDKSQAEELRTSRSNEGQIATLATMIMKNKKHELHRNGFTQRIHALESHLLDGELPRGKAQFKCSLMNKEENDKECLGFPLLSTGKVETRKNIYSKVETFVKACMNQRRKLPASRTACSMMKEVHSLDLQEKLRLGGSSFGQNKVVFKGKRKRETRKRKCIPTMFMPYNEQGNAPPKPDILSSCKSYPLDNGKGSNVVENKDEVMSSSDLIPRAVSVKADDYPVSGSSNGIAAVDAIDDPVATNVEERVELENQESGAAEGSAVQYCASSSDLPVVLKEEKAVQHSTECSSQTTSCKSFKYTFQRKRKKESFICNNENDGLDRISLKKRAGQMLDETTETAISTMCTKENSALDKSMVKGNTGKMQDEMIETKKSSMLNESSRDNRRLFQVARQLLALSERRW